MKRFFASLLILTMVLPLCVFANAAEENVEIKPFVFVTSNSGEYDKVYRYTASRIQGKTAGNRFWSVFSKRYVPKLLCRVLTKCRL